MAKGSKKKSAPGDIATNRQAAFKYNLLERFECGIVLTGTEVKSLRGPGNAQLKDSYATIPRTARLWLIMASPTSLPIRLPRGRNPRP